MRFLDSRIRGNDTFRSKLKLLIFIPLALQLILVLAGCEDPVPSDYIPENSVEAYLLVGEPIKNIIVMKTQPLTDTFRYEQSLIKDADVTISGDGREFSLLFSDSGVLGYYNPDSTYLVKPETKYNIQIRLSNGTIITGETTTPPTTAWVKRGKYMLQYPKDTLNLPPTDTIAWAPVPGYDFYILSVKSLDTLNYGKYLQPPNDELNRRIERPWNKDNDDYFKELTNWPLIANDRTSVVWGVFKWFGMHEVAVFVPDWNFLRWYIQNQAKNQYDSLLSSVHGGKGVFASAAVIRDTFFLIKNQP